jgi:N-carbamoyl-L-amino-acid hydrolase
MRTINGHEIPSLSAEANLKRAMTAHSEDQLTVDSERLQADITTLASYRDNDYPGWSREVFTEPYRESRAWIRRTMIDAGLEVTIDAAGNIIGRLAGRNSNKPALVTGSHTDTVRQGGRFDGIVGVLSGIEIARRLRETGITLQHDLVMVDFLGEEANEFGISCLGSRAITGTLSTEHLNRQDGNDILLGDAMVAYGIDADAATQCRWPRGSVHAYLELHIEQGPLLERSGHQIGIVTAIAGIDRVLARFIGRSGHAGTTPMADRHDALVAAAQAVLTVDRVGCSAPTHGVATSGRIESSPGSMGVITDHAHLWAEIRSVDPSWLQGARRQVVDEIIAHAQARGVDVEIDTLTDQDPVPTHSSLQDIAATVANDLGCSWTSVPSGAGHDAAHLAKLGPIGMIFIPSAGGLSHCPEEFTTAIDIARGAHVLAAALIRLDHQHNPISRQ